MADIIGIDLGTTLSALARLNAIGTPEILPNADGERLTPSALFFDDEKTGTVRVGIEAIHSRHLNAERSVRWIKRHMGDSGYIKNFDGKDYNVVELSSLILKKLASDCLDKSENKPNVVISVPAHFDEFRRKATMDAGTLAGLNVIGIVNEPVAAALYYAATQQIDGKVIVYDIGGGTFDVTILEVNGHKIDIICSEGDHALGGIDFDRKIVELLEQKYRENFDTELITCEEDRAKLEDDAEDIKKTLSRRSVAKKMIYGPAGALRAEITAEMFEEAIMPLVSRTDMLLDVALEQANLKPEQIKNVLMAGGSSRVPLIRKSLQDKFGCEPQTTASVDECVALGAAIHAGLTMLREKPEEVQAGITNGLKNINLTDVCNHSYGTICAPIDKLTGKRVIRNHIILAKNTPLPCEVSETFYTTYAGQKQIEVTITQGEDIDPRYVNTIATRKFDLPPDRDDQCPVKVTYSYDVNQRMHCTFEDVQSGKTLEMKLDVNQNGDSRENELQLCEKVAAVNVE